PWLRNGFRHPDLRAWGHGHRAELVWAALTIGQAWIAAGRSDGRTVLGMFESWSKVIGGILEVAGIAGFLGNLSEFYDAADVEGAEVRGFLAAWWEKHRNTEVTSAQLFEV